MNDPIAVLNDDGTHYGTSPEEQRVGWICPRCGASNSPDVERCSCEPTQYYAQDVAGLFGVGPSEVKEVKNA